MNNTDQDHQKIPTQPRPNHSSGQPVNYHQQPQQVQAHNQTTNLNPDQDRVTSAAMRAPSKHKGFISLVQLLVGAILLAFVINSFVFQSYQVFGESMANTLHEGDRLLISKVNKSFSNIFGDYVPARGDIVVFKSPTDPDTQLIKRVIALPGERVVVANGKITVYNDEFPQGFNPDIDYQDSLPITGTGNIETVVGEDELFVAGDNRQLGGSLDSRNDLGNVPIDNVVGELVLRILPLSNASFF